MFARKTTLADFRTPAVAQACTKQALEAAQRFRLPFARLVRRGPAGDLAGRDGGGALEFQDQRDYHPGDDPRHLNWAAYARTGELTMKVFQQEIRPVLDLVLDTSASMSLEEAKFRRALELARFALTSAEQVGAVVRLYTTFGSEVKEIQPAALADPSWQPFQASPEQGFEPTPPALLRLPWRPNSMRIWISDLLFAGSPDHCVKPLARGATQAMIWCPYLRAEAEPDWAGSCEFEDVEAATKVTKRADAPFVREYLKAYQNHFRLWREAASANQLSLLRLPAEQELLQLLLALSREQVVEAI